jgi:hypothetical protein
LHCLFHCGLHCERSMSILPEYHRDARSEKSRESIMIHHAHAQSRELP